MSVKEEAIQDATLLRVPVAELMSRNVVCVRPEMDLESLRDIMVDRGVSGVPVIDDDGRVVGFVAVTDLVRGMQEGTASIEQTLVREFDRDHDLERAEPDDLDPPAYPPLKPLTAADVMWASPLELPERCTVGQAAALMAKEHVHRLPVVSSDGRAVGMITSLDILGWIAERPRRSGTVPIATPGGPFTDVLDSASDVLACRVSREGVVLDVTAGLATILEMPERDLVGKTWTSLLHPDDRERITSGASFEVRHVKRGGGIAWIEWNAKPGPQGDRLFLGHDVSVQRMARRRLDAHIEICELVAQAQTIGDAGPRILAVLARCEAWRFASLWWKGEGQATPRREASWPVASLEHPMLALGELAGRAWQRGEALWSFEGSAAASDSRQATCAVPLWSATSVVGVLGIAGPVGPLDAQLMRLLAHVASTLGRLRPREPEGRATSPLAVQQLNPETDRLTRLGSLAGGIAHQINNALTHVRLSLGRLLSFELSRRPHTPSRLHRIELLQDVKEGFTLVEGIARQLNRFSRIDDLRREPVDLSTVLDSAAQLVANDVRHRARLVCDYSSIPPVSGDVGALRGVFLNLLMNAAQAIETGRADENEIRIKTRIASAGRVVVEVSDTGVGVSPELIGRIFDPFFTTKPPGGGVGLGLSVSRDIVQDLGGVISMVSVEGRGTTVRVELPESDPLAARSAGEEPSGDLARQGEAVADATVRKRILIVDDDRPVAAAIALELEEHEVVVAGGGREALEILRRDRAFDLVLCDLMMPDVTGMELYESIAKIEPDVAVRFVFMTGGAFTGRAQRFLDEVPNPRIQKPFHPSALMALVRGFASADGSAVTTR